MRGISWDGTKTLILPRTGATCDCPARLAKHPTLEPEWLLTCPHTSSPQVTNVVKHKQEARTLKLEHRPHFSTYRIAPCTYDDDKRGVGGPNNLDAWNVVHDGSQTGAICSVFIVHFDYNYHMVESGVKWDTVRAWHIPDTGKHSFRTALARALGMVAYPGDWYLASRTYDDPGDSYSKLHDERQRRRNEQEILDDFIRDIREVDGSSIL